MFSQRPIKGLCISNCKLLERPCWVTVSVVHGPFTVQLSYKFMPHILGILVFFFFLFF